MTDASGVTIDERVRRRYEVYDEETRLWRPGIGELIRLRTWDIFSRLLPATGLVVDVGGGPGAHAAHLADLGFEVLLVDPLQSHAVLAAGRARHPSGRFSVLVGDARRIPLPDAVADVVLLMGPLYHLVTEEERVAALREAARVLRPDGFVVPEIITRYAWVVAASAQQKLDTPGIWETFDSNINDGLSQNPATMDDGDFWAYMHSPDELARELAAAGLVDVDLIAVEGFGWLLGDLENRMDDPDLLFRALRLTEREPSMLGVSGHVLGVARRPR